MRLVDSHCHLQSDRFADDVDIVLGAARDAGVERILVPGWDRASSEAALDLVDRFPWLDAAVGVHPHDASNVDDAGWQWFVRAADDDRVAAIGETGLDFDRMFSPAEAQVDNLRRNLALALATRKPAILHCRSAAGRHDAQDALVAELRAAGFDGEPARRAFGAAPAAIVHSYSGSADYARVVVGMGLAISFGGLVFRAGEEGSVEAARMTPAERLLIETDAPYLSPPGAPRRRNAPEHVAITAAWLADRRDVGRDGLGDQLVAAYDSTFPRGRPR